MSDEYRQFDDRVSRTAHEQFIDSLINLVAREEMRRPDSVFYTDARFIERLTSDLKARSEIDAKAARTIDAIAMRLYARLLSRSLPHRILNACPRERIARVSTPASVAIGEARAVRCAPRYDLAVAAGAGRELWEEPCSSWVELPRDVPGGDHVALTVAGDSMEPLIHSGDVVLVKLGRTLAAGSLVVARGPDDGYLIKRLGRVLGPHVELQSLNPAFGMQQMPNDPSRVLGTVILRWCDHAQPDRTPP